MIFQLKGKFQHYPWGGRYFIPHFLKLTEVVDQPYAEYWLGAHPAASATIKFGEQWLPLADVIKQAPELLGERSRQQFGDNLPYLLKILDIKQPLSIQLHPNKAQAEYGFNQENRQGIPLEDVRRIYKDRNHKPEMMIALSDFWLLHGFKSITAIQACLAKYPSTSALAKSLVEKSLAVVYAEIMHADQTQLASWLRPIIEQRRADYLADKLKLSDPDYWLLYMTDDLAADAPLDAGLMCFYLFNIVHLKKGEGIYQAANLPHAYLRGQSIELMANSDNVIRGGLTTKWVDIPALLQAVDYRPVRPQIIAAYRDDKTVDQNFYLYPTPQAKDFALQRLTIRQLVENRFVTDSASMLLVMKGSLYIDLGNTSFHLNQGDAVFISADSHVELIGENDGYAIIASLP